MMKNVKAAAACLILSLCMLLASCGAVAENVLTNIDVSEAAQTLYVSLSFDDTLMQLSDEVVASSYKFTSADKTAVYTGSGSTAEEIIVCSAKDEASVKTLTKELENYKKKRIDTYKGYAPAEVPKLEKAQITSSGLYVFYIVCADSDAAASVLEDYINGKI